MSGRFKKILAVLLICSIVVACLPMATIAASRLEIEEKINPGGQAPIDPSGLSDGEIKTCVNYYTSDSIADTDFTVEMSALGQGFHTSTTTTQKYNVVFVLDVSSSMGRYSRFENMLSSANAAIRSLQDKNGSNIKISLVSFANDAKILHGLTSNRMELVKTTPKSPEPGVDYVEISLSSGTNIQAGFNCAYKILNEAKKNNDDSLPVIILLSDGAPTYYYKNLKDYQSGSSGSIENIYYFETNAPWTIAQAAYIKLKMPEVQIYTIPFSLEYEPSTLDVATATLNPTSENLSKITNFMYNWNNIVNDTKIISADDAARITASMNYVDASYVAANSAESLTQAMNSIIENIQQKKPIQETIIHGALDDASYLKMSYHLGTGFALNTETVRVYLSGNEYVFTAGADGVYTSTASELSSVLLKYEDDTLTWMIPASVLPCNTPEGASQVLAEPIKLSFIMKFDINAVTADGSYTTGYCDVEFTPVMDDPYYYAIKGKCYAAIYPYPGDSISYGSSNLPLLTGFAVSNDEFSLSSSYINNPATKAVVNSYTDKPSTSSKPSYYYDVLPRTVYIDGDDLISVSYEGTSISFEGASRYEARAEFHTLNLTDKDSYTITYFSDGKEIFTDASIVSVSGAGNGKVNVTISYDGGKRSIEFIKPDLRKNNKYVETNISAEFKLEKKFGNNYKIILNKFGGKKISDYDMVCNQTGSEGNIRIYDITLTVDGIDYFFSGLRFKWNSSGDTTYALANLEAFSAISYQYYYYTEINGGYSTSGPYSDYIFEYDEDTAALTVKMKDSGDATWTVDGPYSPEDGYTVKPNKDGYTVSKVNADGSIKVIEYYVEDGKLYKRESTVFGQNGVDIISGKVFYTHTSSSSITVKEAMNPEDWAEECGAQVELSSTSRTPFALADSSGIAYIYLYFTVEKEFRAPQFTLELNGFSSEATELRKLNSGSYAGDYLSSLTDPDQMLEPGTYRIKYKLQYLNMAYKPDLVTVLFSEMSFISEELEALLIYDSSNSGHRVNISMTATQSH